MFLEALSYFQQKVINPQAREYGYVYRSIALEQRYKRCHESWRHHLSCSHKEIKKIVSEVNSNFGALWILGSGLLLETPLELFLDSFDKIFLVDAVHLSSLRRKVKLINKKFNRKKVFLVEEDLSGTWDKLTNNNYFNNTNFDDYYTVQSPLKFGNPYLKFSEGEIDYFFQSTCDLVISANVLSQLALAPGEVLRKNWISLKKNKYPQEEIERKLSELTLRIEKTHLDFLQSLTCPSILLVDTNCFLKADKSVSFPSLEYLRRGCELPGKLMAQWDWDFAPPGEYDKINTFSLNVQLRYLKKN